MLSRSNLLRSAAAVVMHITLLWMPQSEQSGSEISSTVSIHDLVLVVLENTGNPRQPHMKTDDASTPPAPAPSDHMRIDAEDNAIIPNRHAPQMSKGPNGRSEVIVNGLSLSL